MCSPLSQTTRSPRRASLSSRVNRPRDDEPAHVADGAEAHPTDSRELAGVTEDPIDETRAVELLGTFRAELVPVAHVITSGGEHGVDRIAAAATGLRAPFP